MAAAGLRCGQHEQIDTGIREESGVKNEAHALAPLTFARP